MQVRPAHMANGDTMMQDGSFLFGGGILVPPQFLSLFTTYQMESVAG